MKYKVYLVTIFLFLGTALFAENFEREREIVKSFQINKDTEVQISNKYGNVQIIHWDKDSVRFEVEISVIGNKLSKVNKTFDYIDIEFTGNTYYIIANTQFKNERNSFWTDVSDITNSIFKGGNNTKIHYTVYMPESNPLKIKNKFGNIYLANRFAKTEIDLSNGDFRANNINDHLKFNFSYGSAHFKKVDQAFIDINYGDIRLDSINQLTLDSKSSTLNCEYIDQMQIVSKRDKFYLGTVKNINGNFSFSKINIDILLDMIKLDSDFGELNAYHVNESFRNINLKSKNTDISLRFSRTTVYKIDLSFTQRTNVTLPFNCKVESEEATGKNGDDTLMKASSGEITKSSPNVVIKQESGSIRLSKK